MYEVFVWVPSKGWKLLMRTRKIRDAVAKAQEFQPLNVSITFPGEKPRVEGGNIIDISDKFPYMDGVDKLAAELDNKDGVSDLSSEMDKAKAEFGK